MGADLLSVIVALTNLTDSELIALIDATKNVPPIAPGLLAWLNAALDWELNRRRGRDRAPQSAAFAILPAEDAGNILTIATLRGLFGPRAHGVYSLLDALTELLTGRKRTH